MPALELLKLAASRWYLFAIAGLCVVIVVLKLDIAQLDLKVEKCEHAATAKENAANKAVAKRQSDEAIANAELSGKYATAITTLSNALGTANAAIARTGSSTGCINTDAARVFTNGVRQPAGANSAGPVRPEGPGNGNQR